MANAKIISFVDHQINAALEPVLDDVEVQRVDLVRHIAILTDRVRQQRSDLTNAIADNTLNLRHDIKTINDLIRILREDLNALAGAVNSLAQELGQLKQDADQLKQGGAPPDTSA